MPSAATATSSIRSVVKSAVQGTVIYSIPLIGQRLAGIILLSIVTRVLTPEDYGMLSLLEQFTIVVSTLLGVQFSSALGYFYFEKDTVEHRARVAGTAVGGAFALGTLASLVCLSASGFIARHVFGSPDALRYLYFVFLAMPLNFLGEALFGWLRVTDRQRVFALGSLLRLVLTVGGIGILVGIFKLHVIAYMVTVLGTLFIAAVVFSIYLIRATPIRWSYPLFRRMVTFSFPLSLSGIAMFVINFGDQFVLRHFHTLAEVGIYAMAYRISMLVNTCMASFYSYWNAQVYQILRREDAQAVFARFFTYCTLLVTICALVLVLGAQPGLHILVAPAFRPAALLVPILVAANSIRSLGEFLRTRFLAAGRPRYETYCTWGGMAVCVALYLLLIPRFGRWGAAWATLLTFVAMVVASVVWTYRVSPYRVEGPRLLKLAGVTAAVLAIHYAVPLSWLPAQIAWSLFTFALFPFGLYLLRFATPGELRVVQSFIGKYTARLSAS